MLYDTGLRVGETVALDVNMLDFDDGVLMLPGGIQKDYPTDRSPHYVEIELHPETVRTLRTYLAACWKDSLALFPSRQADRMTKQSVRNVVSRAAHAADVAPLTVNGLQHPRRRVRPRRHTRADRRGADGRQVDRTLSETPMSSTGRARRPRRSSETRPLAVFRLWRMD